jgi:glycosyltransferase 2 family protein
MPSEPTRDQVSRARLRKRVFVGVQVSLTLGVFGVLIARTDIPALLVAFHKAPLWRIPAATGTFAVLLLSAAIRWRILLGAYGAEAPPALTKLWRLQFIGLLYNMLPGAVGGDVVRGLVTRSAFGEHGLSAGLTIVMIERVLGLMGIVLLVVSVLGFHPIAKLQLPPHMLVLAVLGGIGALLAVAAGRRLSEVLPGKLGELAASLPELASFPLLAAALGMSIINQTLVGVFVHLLVSGLAPSVQMLDSLVLGPLSMATIFVPITVAGAGARDAAMVWLYGLIGVPAEQALLASLQILVCYVVLAAFGGLLGMLAPLDAGMQPAAADGATDAKAG